MARRLMTVLAIVSLGVLALAFTGCGSKKSAATTETTTTETTTTTTETTTAATDTTSTDTTGTPDFASAKNCREFAQITSQISSALTGSGSVADVQKAFDELAAAAPSEIKGDFETLSKYFGQVADAVGNLKAGETPSADAIAKLQAIDTTEVNQASQNIAKWTSENCTR
jgi:hypothetical protein